MIAECSNEGDYEAKISAHPLGPAPWAWCDLDWHGLGIEPAGSGATGSALYSACCFPFVPLDLPCIIARHFMGWFVDPSAGPNPAAMRPELCPCPYHPPRRADHILPNFRLVGIGRDACRGRSRLCHDCCDGSHAQQLVGAEAGQMVEAFAQLWHPLAVVHFHLHLLRALD